MHPAEAALEYDRTKVAEGVTRIQHTLGNYHWLLDGRGSYEWDDDRYRQEFKTACELLQKDLEPLVRIAADWSNCPKKWEEVQSARAPAATQEQPAGSEATPSWTQIIEEGLAALGSPRKVGEDGALREALLLLPRKEYEVSGDGYVKLSDVLAALPLSSPIELPTCSCNDSSNEDGCPIHGEFYASNMGSQASSEIREALAAIPGDVDTLISRAIYGETVEDVRRKVAGYLERALAPSRQGAGGK